MGIRGLFGEIKRNGADHPMTIPKGSRVLFDYHAVCFAIESSHATPCNDSFGYGPRGLCKSALSDPIYFCYCSVFFYRMLEKCGIFPILITDSKVGALSDDDFDAKCETFLSRRESKISSVVLMEEIVLKNDTTRWDGLSDAHNRDIPLHPKCFLLVRRFLEDAGYKVFICPGEADVALDIISLIDDNVACVVTNDTDIVIMKNTKVVLAQIFLQVPLFEYCMKSAGRLAKQFLYGVEKIRMDISPTSTKNEVRVTRMEDVRKMWRCQNHEEVIHKAWSRGNDFPQNSNGLKHSKIFYGLNRDLNSGDAKTIADAYKTWPFRQARIANGTVFDEECNMRWGIQMERLTYSGELYCSRESISRQLNGDPMNFYPVLEKHGLANIFKSSDNKRHVILWELIPFVREGKYLALRKALYALYAHTNVMTEWTRDGDKATVIKTFEIEPASPDIPMSYFYEPDDIRLERFAMFAKSDDIGVFGAAVQAIQAIYGGRKFDSAIDAIVLALRIKLKYLNIQGSYPCKTLTKILNLEDPSYTLSAGEHNSLAEKDVKYFDSLAPWDSDLLDIFHNADRFSVAMGKRFGLQFSETSGSLLPSKVLFEVWATFMCVLEVTYLASSILLLTPTAREHFLPLDWALVKFCHWKKLSIAQPFE